MMGMNTPVTIIMLVQFFNLMIGLFILSGASAVGATWHWYAWGVFLVLIGGLGLASKII